MESHEASSPVVDYHSNVDTSRPFGSVKEAVAILGERFLAGEIMMPMSPLVKPPIMMNPRGEISFDLVSKPMSEEEEQTGEENERDDRGPGYEWKMLEAQLEKAKKELRIIKERKPEMEIFHPAEHEEQQADSNDKVEILSNGLLKPEVELEQAKELRVVEEIQPETGIFDPVGEQPRSSNEEEHKRSDAKENHEGLSGGLKKLEAELEETKKELRILKERESETEIALAALNAELHKSMSRLAKVEAVEAKAKAVAVTTRSLSTSIANNSNNHGKARADSDRIIDRHRSYFPTLAQILSVGNDPRKKKKQKQQPGCYGGIMSGSSKENYYNSKKKVQAGNKEKPIVPLVGDILFSWRKKASSPTFPNSLYSSPRFFK